ncbi:ubiquitin ligase with a HECT domain at the C-terminus [Cryptosporidium bovis]|uniref:ubiquitin ligase with a HECT domain at the C-terminus n=1 Tax=Cryptosporidium bovis TaxID=310047 RepID=UPI00351AA635|nr:ubiquitin ligase with a HECT domain at the C-terminus [Cryptosporidium bovis]
MNKNQNVDIIFNSYTNENERIKTKQMVLNRYYYPIKILSELGELGVSPLRMSENYILNSVEQIIKLDDIEVKKNFVSILINCSIKRERVLDHSEYVNNTSNIVNINKLLKMDPLDNNEYYSSELLRESLFEYFKKMVGSEDNIIKVLSDQMNQYLKLSNAKNIDELINVRRISEILSQGSANFEGDDYFINGFSNISSKNKILDSKIINFPFILLRLRESIINQTLNNLTDSIEEIKIISRGNLIKTSYSLFNNNVTKLFYDQKSQNNNLFELKNEILTTNDNNYELKILMEFIVNYIDSRDDVFKTLKGNYDLFEYKYRSMVKYLSKDCFNTEQGNLIIELSLRTLIKTRDISLLLFLIHELVQLKEYIDKDTTIKINGYIWNKMQLLGLKSDCYLYTLQEKVDNIDDKNQDEDYCSNKNSDISLSFKNSNYEIYNVPLFKYVYIGGIPIYGCSIIQFSLVSDSRIFNNVIQEDNVRTRIEVLLTNNDDALSENIQINSKSISKFDTRKKGGSNFKIPYSIFTLELLDNVIYIYINPNFCHRKTSKKELSVKKVLENYYSGDYIVEFVCYTEIVECKAYKTCLSIYINGEFVYKYYFNKELYDMLTLYQKSSVNFQITMTDGVHLEVNDECNYSNNLIKDTLVKNDIIDNIDSIKNYGQNDSIDINYDSSKYNVRVSVDELLLFLSGIWRRVIVKKCCNTLVKINNHSSTNETNNMNILCLIHKILSNLISKNTNDLIGINDVTLLINLALIFKYIFSDNNNLVTELLSNNSGNNNNNILITIDDCFQLILKLMNIKFRNGYTSYEWLVKTTGINILSQMNSLLLTYIFYTTKIDNIVEFIKIIINVDSNVTNEIVELFKHFITNNIFNLIVTRLLKNRDFNMNNESIAEYKINSYYFILLSDMLTININGNNEPDIDNTERNIGKTTDLDFKDDKRLNSVEIFNYLTENLMKQIKSEKKKYYYPFWIYKEYDIFKQKNSLDSSYHKICDGFPLYYFNFNKRIILNILLNIFVINGMTISQHNVLFYLLDNFDRRVFNEINKYQYKRRFENKYVELDSSNSSNFSGKLNNFGRMRRHSSSMYIVESGKVKKKQMDEYNETGNNYNDNNNINNYDSDNNVVKDNLDGKVEDHLELNKNIIFWRDAMYEIFRILIIYSENWFESNNFLYENESSYKISKTNDEQGYNKIKTITDKIYKVTSGIYTKSNIIWFGYFLKYGVTESLGNFVSFTMSSLEFFKKEIKFNYNIDICKQKLIRIEKMTKFLLQKIVISLNIKIMKDIMVFNKKFSCFSREIMDCDILNYKIFNDNLHPIIETHILFNWLKSQLLMWSYVDISKIFKEYLLFSVGENGLIVLNDIHPIIYTDIIENKLKYENINNYKIIHDNLKNGDEDWIDTLISMVNDESLFYETNNSSNSNIEFIEKIINSDLDTINSLGKYWRNFHPKYKNVQLAIYSVVLHLFGIKNLNDIDDKKKYVLDLSLDISIRSCSQILSNIQTQISNTINDEIDLQEQIKNKELFIDSTIKRCRWIIDNIPFNLFNDFYNNCINFGSNNIDDNHNINKGGNLNQLIDENKKNRRATDTNITFNNKLRSSNHINMIKQLLNIRRKSSQYNNIDNSSISINSVSSSSSNPAENRNYSDPSLLTTLPPNILKNEKVIGNSIEKRPIDLNDALNVYINFILNGPQNINDYNKLIKSELFTILLRIMTVESVRIITNFNTDYKISLQSYLRYEGWIYIRMLHLFIINEFNIKQLTETESIINSLKKKDYGTNNLLSKTTNGKGYSEIKIKPHFNLNIKNLSGIITNLRKWLVSIDHKNIDDNDEFWFDSSLRTLLLYSIFKDKKETFILEQLSKYIFPFANKDEENVSSENYYLQHENKFNIKDSITGIIIVDIVTENEINIVNYLKEQGYYLEQIIGNKSAVQNIDDYKIYLFVQRLSNLPLYSIPVLSCSKIFKTYYNIKLNKLDNAFILNPNNCENIDSKCFSSESISYSECSSDSLLKYGDDNSFIYSNVYTKLYKKKSEITRQLLIEGENEMYSLECIIPLNPRKGSLNSEVMIEEMENALMEVLDFDDLGAINLKTNIYDEIDQFNFVCLYSKKINVKNTYTKTILSKMNNDTKIELNSKKNVLDRCIKKKADYIQKHIRKTKLPFILHSNKSSISSSLSSSSSIVLKKMNPEVINNSYIIRLRKRGWIMFKSYMISILVSTNNDLDIKEITINYVFNLLSLISKRIMTLNDKSNSIGIESNIDELMFCVEDTINILVYAVQLTCYSTKLKNINEKVMNNSLLVKVNRNDNNTKSDDDILNKATKEISYLILAKFLKFHDGEKHLLKDLWTKNSSIETKLSLLLTECIRQCTLTELIILNYCGNNHENVNFEEKSSNELFNTQLNDFSRNENNKKANINTLSISLPDLHIFPNKFLKMISSELIYFTQEINKDSLPNSDQIEDKNSKSEVQNNIINDNNTRLRSEHQNVNNNINGDISPAFRNHPHSSIFIGALQTDNFNVNIDERVVHCDLATLGGGIVVCRAPLTFRGLQSTGLSIPPNILSFRVLGLARFGITVAPSNVLTMPLEEVFQRNDVVGLKPQVQLGIDNRNLNNDIYQLPENMFALEISYIEGTVIDIRYGVTTNSTGSILRSEIFIGGESIGSVLEVQFNELAQISEETRLAVIFVVLDPLTILYEGLPFSTRYRRRSSTWFETIQGVITENNLGIQTHNSSSNNNVDIDKELEKINLKHKYNTDYIEYIQNIKLFQEILISNHNIVNDIKDTIIESIYNCFSGISNEYSKYLYNYYKINEKSIDIIRNNSVIDIGIDVIDSLLEKTLLLCSICTIFGIDINPLEEDTNEVLNINKNVSNNILNYDNSNGGRATRTKNDRELLLRRRCSNIVHGDLPWLSSSVDSGVLCYTCLYGLNINQLELLLRGYLKLFKVEFINKLYFLLGIENIKINYGQDDNHIVKYQRQLLESISVLISRSSLVISLVTRVILEFYPNYNSKCLFNSELNDTLYDLFCLMSNFSLYSCEDSSGNINNQIFDIYSQYCDFKDENVEDSMEEEDRKSLINIISSIGVECKKKNISKNTEYNSNNSIDIDSNSEEANDFDIPLIELKTILLPEDCNTLWKWLSEQDFILNTDTDHCLGSIKHLDNSIYGKLSMNQRIFNLEGSNPVTAKTLVLKSNGTTAIWSIKISAIDIICNICGIIPDRIINNLFLNKSDIKLFSNKFFQLLRIMRICTYFIIRGREDFVFPAAHQIIEDNNHLSPSPDYWLMYRRSLCNDINAHSDIVIKKSTEYILNKIDYESVLIDKLYSWQRIIYICISKLLYEESDNNLNKNLRSIIVNHLKTEIIFHLVGSIIQIYSIRKIESFKNNNSSKQLKYSSLSPSVYVAHWLMDQFIRHPLCPSLIRKSIINNLTWNSLFSLITNGVHIPTKLAIDSCRMTYWITTLSINNNCNKPDQIQGILDSICYCVSCILSLYESKVSFENDNSLVNINNLPVFRELILGKVPITQLGWDHFTSAEDYKPINRQKINTTLVCHFMACSARCILDSSDEYTILPLPHILSFFNKYLSFISISNHLMLSTSDTIIHSNDEHNILNDIGNNTENNIRPNTLFPWKYIQNTLNYINTRNVLIKQENDVFTKEYYSLLRINYGNNIESDILDRYKRNNINNNNNNIYHNQLNKSIMKNSGFIGFKIEPVKLEYCLNDKSKGSAINKLPRIIYSVSELSGAISEFGGYEFGLVSYKIGEIIKSTLNNSDKIIVNNDNFKLNVMENHLNDFNSKKHKNISYDIYDYNIYNIRLDKLLYVNGLHTSNVNIKINFSKHLNSFSRNPIKHMFIGGIVFNEVLDGDQISEFYNYWIKNELIHKIKLKKNTENITNCCNENTRKKIYADYGYLGTVIYSFYDDRCLTFGNENIKNSLTRIRATKETIIKERFKSSKIDMNIIFQNRLLTFEIDNTPFSITGLTPNSKFMLPIICINVSNEAVQDNSTLECNIIVRNSLNNVFIPYNQIVSKVDYLPIIQNSIDNINKLKNKNYEYVKWIPNELKHNFNYYDDNSNSSSDSLLIKVKERNELVCSLAGNHTRIIEKFERSCNNIKNEDNIDDNNDTNNYKHSNNDQNKSVVSVLGYLYPCIPSGISLCSSNNTRKELYSNALFNNWSNCILPNNSSWFIINKRESGKIEQIYSYGNGKFKRKILTSFENDIDLNSSKTKKNNKSGEIANDFEDENYYLDESDVTESPPRTRLFKNLTPGKSFSVTFNITESNNLNNNNESNSIGYGVGIDWLDGLFRYIWLSDGRLLVSLIPPLPYEISKLNKEYKIPINKEIIIYNDDFCSNNEDYVKIEKYTVNDEITLEFQPNIPAILFFKNGDYCFSFNFTEFYKNIGNYYINDITKLFDENCEFNNDYHNHNTIMLNSDLEYDNYSLTEKQIWILRTLVVMAILENDSYILDKLIMKYKKYLIDSKKGEFLFKVLISDDLYNNILNCIPKSVLNTKSSLRSLLNNIYDYVKFPNTRDYCLFNRQTMYNSNHNNNNCTNNICNIINENEESLVEIYEEFNLNWDLLDKIFTINIKDEIDKIQNSVKIFCEKRSVRIVKHETPFWLACWIGCEDIVRCLLKYLDINNTGANLENLNNSNNNKICEIKESKSVKLVTSIYIGCHYISENDNNGLHSYNVQIDNELLIENDIKHESFLQTGIMGSVISGNTRMVYLLSCIYDSDINIQDKQGNTCYHFAIAYGNLSIIQLLTYKGINPYIINKKKQFAGSIYRNMYKNYVEKDKKYSFNIDPEINKKYNINIENIAYNKKSVNNTNFESAIDDDYDINLNELDNTTDNYTNEWFMTPKPPKICFHTNRSEIVEFTQQYEKIYCFSVYNKNSIKLNTNESYKIPSPSINLNINNKSNLLPPYQYPWPGLLSDCQIISVIDHSINKNMVFGVDNINSNTEEGSEVYISIKSLNIGGIYNNSNVYVGNQNTISTQAPQNNNCNNLLKKLYDKKKLNIHIIQYLFYRWLRSIRPFGTNRSSGSTISLLSSNINRVPDTGRPVDDIAFNMNSTNYHQNNAAENNSNNINESQQGNNNVIHHQFLHRISGRRDNNARQHDEDNSNNNLSNNAFSGTTGLSHSGINLDRNSAIRSANYYFTSSSPTLSSTLPCSYSYASPGKIFIKQEVVDEIYNGLSQVDNIKQILEIIHVTYKYINQIVLLKTSISITANHKISEIVFPKNAGLSTGSSSISGGISNCVKNNDTVNEDKSCFESSNDVSHEFNLQELMIRSCWELLEMEESIDDKQGYYPYWTSENERYIWIHNIRKLLSLISNDYNNLDYISCNSWIEWIPNLDLFDKSIFNKYKKMVIKMNNKNCNDSELLTPKLNYEFMLKPIISVDMKILQKMHLYCQNNIDQNLVKLMNIELTVYNICKVLVYELLNQMSFCDKKEYENDIDKYKINNLDIKNKTLMILGIKNTDISKLLPKNTSSIWNKTKISPSDSVDMVRFISNSIKNLIVSVILKHNFDKENELSLLGIDFMLNKKPSNSSSITDNLLDCSNKYEVFENIKSTIDVNNIYYEDSEFPFKIIEMLLNKTLPIYTTSIDVFTKIQINNSPNQSLNKMKLKIQALCWYIDIIQQFIYGRILLLNKFNDLSKYTIPMISGVYNSPTLNYEQEDFLRISSSYYFVNNFYGDLFWRLSISGDAMKNIREYQDSLNHNRTSSENNSDNIVPVSTLLLQSSKLLGTWGGYHNIYSSPRYLIHIGPYDLPIPISSYLLLKPFYKLSLINTLWNDIIKRLIDYKKRDNNGNTTANNGLTVHLNRNLAVNGNDPLKYSLLSQSTRQILHMLPEKLRITERPFLIVFRGEGSTDFGGPFQEFLSWISNEIMNKNNEVNDKEYQISNNMQYNGLFTLCANALHSIGHNQDTVTINSMYSNYKTIESIYICEDFLLFSNMDNLTKNNELTLLKKFKYDYYRKRLFKCDDNIKKDSFDLKIAIPEFKNIVNKIPSLKCNHNYSNPNNILTTTMDCNINYYSRKNINIEGNNYNNNVNNRYKYTNDDNDSVDDCYQYENDNDYYNEETENEYEMEVEDYYRDDGGLVNTSSSMSSLSSIPLEMDNNETINNTNPTPILNSEINTQREHNIDDMGIIHKLDPWEWPIDKDMKEIISEMYECLGRLMGICVTTKSALNINLNPLIWKKFSGLPLSLKDLVDADCIAYEMLNSLKSIENENINKQRNISNSSSNTSVVPEIEGLTFQIENMNGNIILLLNSDDSNSNNNEFYNCGSNIGVNLNNLHLFIQLAERCRMMDDSDIMINILKGFGTIIPLGRMRMLFNYQKIEYLICGESKIDLNVLKNHTVSPHPELKEQLFKVLETFNNEQLQKLLRFVSGRSRLPQVNNSSDWKFSINYDNPDTIQDNRLPIATTCGFRLSLPRYSSIEILRSRLLYAINNCVAIDLDAYVIHDN